MFKPNVNGFGLNFYTYKTLKVITIKSYLFAMLLNMNEMVRLFLNF